ncbi:phosphatidate cytidylyltransferase [Marinobacterium arenosum]|uniref:phosphatidate cytidylyltransferase n=1 Tax=Marinobacterium arenosum TaxID=2862496 RepID=UPI001C97A886|nr:phosphatidate cytidylyltransferase [Marinobacterium arenosum]MBY4675648.1 phosphatidate cytidylyltransferase [Marinobacterium arenosum]
MLKKRLLTALVLAPLVLWSLFYLSLEQLLVLVDLVLLLAAWEWSALAGLGRRLYRLGYVASHAVLLAVMHAQIDRVPSPGLFVAPLILWAVALWWVVRYPAAGLWRYTPVRGAAGYLVLLPCWFAFVVVKSHPWADQLLLLLVLLVWGADIGAYFAGKNFGRTKLARVSPGKTREGVYGGLLTCLLIALGSAYWLELPLLAAVYLLLLALMTGLISVLGDLFESMLKRHCGLKDSGRLLPGHGGVMDRIDSLTAAAPLFAIGIQFLPAS